MATILYFTWLQKHYPEEYKDLQKFTNYAYYSESYALALKHIKEKLPDKLQSRIYGSGDGCLFCYIEYYGCPRNKCFQKPDALIVYAKKQGGLNET